MKNFFALIGLLVVAFVGVGIWQGWFKFAVNSDNKVTVEVDGKKAGEDVQVGWEKAKEAGREKLEELKKKDDTEPTPPSPLLPTAPANTPGPLVK